MPLAKKPKKRGFSKQAAFLAAYAVSARIDKAAIAAGLDRSLHYRWLSEDAAYALLFAAARKQAGDALESEAVRRAYEGYNEPVVYQGGLCYAEDQYVKDPKTKRPTARLKRGAQPLTIRKYDSGLLHKLLDGLLPETYKKRALEVSGPNGGPIQLEGNERLQGLTDDELQTALALARKLS